MLKNNFLFSITLSYLLVYVKITPFLPTKGSITYKCPKTRSASKLEKYKYMGP
jgi:hypothetical protein